MADLNTINLRTEMMIGALDAVYKKASVTSRMDYTGPLVKAGANAKTIQIAKRTLAGLADHTRNNGFVAGGATLTWETHTFTQERSREFSVPKMDDDESGANAFGSLGSLGGQFVTEEVAPEVDAYRFAKICGTSGISTVAAADLTTSTVKAAIDLAIETMDDDEVPDENRCLYLSNKVYNLMKNAGFLTFTRDVQKADGSVNVGFADYDGIPVVKVPKGRFYTAIDLYDGTSSGETAGGYAKATAGKSINFLLVHDAAVAGITKIAEARYFAPEVNQKGPDHLLQYLLYHDLFVFENKVKGIYLHKAAA